MKKKKQLCEKKQLKLMLARKFANYRLYMAEITQNKQKCHSFCCGPSRQEKLWSNYIKKKKILTLKHKYIIK